MKLTQKTTKLGILLITLIFVGILSKNIFYFLHKYQSDLFNYENIENSPSPTTYPYQEMTIPYLRTREYNSTLGPLEQIAENETYTTYITNYISDSLRINGLLTIPKSESSNTKWPAIIFIHGYIPPTQYRTRLNYQSYVDSLARNKFVVFKIDLRGHDQSEGEASGAYFSSDYIIDTLNAYSALQNSNFVYANNIGLWAHSMAGNITLRALAVKPQIPATVIWAGAVYTYKDMLDYGIQDSSYVPPASSSARTIRRQKLRELYGDFTDSNNFWQQVAPTKYLTDLKSYIQVHHSQDDTVVNIEYSRNLVKLLSANNVTHEYYEYQSGGHNISGNSFNQAMTRTIDFYKLHLTN